jgi:hypothetical protein
VPALSSSLISPALEQIQDLPAGDRRVLAGQCPSLAGHLARVPDPRDPRGVRHTLTSLLMAAVAAVLAGARSFTEIGEWVGDAPPWVLAVLGIRYEPLAYRFKPPDEATIRRSWNRWMPPRWRQQWDPGWPPACRQAASRPGLASGNGGRWRWTARRCAAPGMPAKMGRPCTCSRRPSSAQPSCSPRPRSMARPMRSSVSPRCWSHWT